MFPVRRNMGMAIFALLMIMILGGWDSYASSAAQGSDGEKLWNFSQQEMDGPVRVVMQAGTVFESYSDSEDFLKLANRASDLLGLPHGSVQLQDGAHLRYETVLPAPYDITATLIIMGVNEGEPTYLFMKVQGQSVSSFDPLETLRDRLNARLQSIGLHPQWNTTVQGKLKTEGGSEAAVRTLWSRLDKAWQASKVESYEDEGTSSISFYTPRMKMSIQSGGRPMNLQVAVHRVTETNDLRVTFGVPIIVTEY